MRERRQSWGFGLATTLAILLSATCIAADTNLYNSLPRDSENAALHAIQSFTPNQLLTLCNDFGRAVDAGRESGEGFLEVIALNNYERHTNLTFAVIVAEVENENNSLFWRRMACRFSCGREHYLDRKEIPTAEAVARWHALLVSDNTPSILKKEVRSAAAYLFKHSSEQEEKAIQTLLTQRQKESQQNIRQVSSEAAPSAAPDEPSM